MDEISPKLRGTLPAAARAKMVHHRAYNAGRGDNPHGATTPVATEPDDEEQWLSRYEKHPDYDPNKSFFTKVED